MDQTKALFDLKPYTSSRHRARRYPRSRGLSPEVATALHSLQTALGQLPPWELERRRASYEEWDRRRFK